MTSAVDNRRLCRFIDDSLRHITSSLENSELRVSKTSEKKMLISLSKVFKQIQLWINEFDSSSESDEEITCLEPKDVNLDHNISCSSAHLPSIVVMEVKLPYSINKSSSESECCCGNHDCLTNTIGHMILLLSVESRFVQHLVGNILVAISDYFTASESNWAHFLKSMCICLELAISNALLRSLDRPQCSNHGMSPAILALQTKLKHAIWSSVACVVRVLRTILKRMKQDIDDELLQIYLNSVSACLANVPWDVMDQNWEAISVSSDLLEDRGGQLKSRSMFHGTLVQLFCSLVNVSDSQGANKSFNGHPIVRQISNLVPTLLGWCFGSGKRNNVRMFEYFRHKNLMLMIRLGFLIDLEDSLLFSWLNLIHEYFEDLLLLPMNQPDQEDTLEGSPFISSICDTHKRVLTSRHLQRLVVLLFLRCSFSLIGLTDIRGKQIGNESDLTYSCKNKGLSELRWWLQIHLPSEFLGASDCHLERCTNFSISFLRLFIHEDDILFELLLLLICVPFNAKQKDGKDIHAFQEMNNDILLHVSIILNPVQLFHLFLSELHYDHQVLLDYLISKDTGVPSAEYLLRSLHIVCDSWTKFVEFSLEGEVTDLEEGTRPSGKKRKVLADGSDLWARVGSSTRKGDSTPSSLEKHHQEAILHSDVCSRTSGQLFGKAKNCLLLLEKTIQNLHQKELFPYNPKVLLRRLARFQELCFQQ